MEKVSRSPFVLVVLVVVYLFCFSTAADAKAKVDSTDTDHQTWHTDSAEQCPHAVDPAITSLLSDDPYVVLGLPRDATDARITKKFRTLARKWHPDKNRPNEDSSSSCAAATSATTLFTAIGHAYNILSDPEKRDVYDRLGVLGLRRLQDGKPPCRCHPCT